MEKVSDKIYSKINNDIYNNSEIWWQPTSAFYLLKTTVNPWRVTYAVDVLKKLDINPKGKTALDVGCGGGVLTEEICKMGFTTTGIDPAEGSIHAAREHTKAEDLNIRYITGPGENMPFDDQSFDVVFCGEVLQHVRDLPKVISEISRVLKPGGVFIYDTFNRTFISKLVGVKIYQEWKRWAFMPPNLHVWEMFIKPGELKKLLAANGFEWKEHIGSEPSVSIPKLLGFLRKRAKGEWSYTDLGKNFRLVKSSDMNIIYGGYAIKK